MKDLFIEELVPIIDKADEIVILPHVDPDGDALGSALALALALKSQNKTVNVYLEENVSNTYSFLPGLELVLLYDWKSELRCKKPELIIVLDTGDLERLGKRIEIFNQSENTINIDHHMTNTRFARYNVVNAKMAAVGEGIQELITKLRVKINKDIATCLYVSISTDTGGFRFSNTTADTHKKVADLINSGVDVSNISQNIFESTSKNKLYLLGNVISNMELYQEDKIAVSVIDMTVMENLGISKDDDNGMANVLRGIKSVEVAAIIKEREHNEYKISLRSKNFVNVAEIAAMYGGGGHARASGFTVRATLKEIKEKLIHILREKVKHGRGN